MTVPRTPPSAPKHTPIVFSLKRKAPHAGGAAADRPRSRPRISAGGTALAPPRPLFSPAVGALAGYLKGLAPVRRLKFVDTQNYLHSLMRDRVLDRVPDPRDGRDRYLFDADRVAEDLLLCHPGFTVVLPCIDVGVFTEPHWRAGVRVSLLSLLLDVARRVNSDPARATDVAVVHMSFGAPPPNMRAVCSQADDAIVVIGGLMGASCESGDTFSNPSDLKAYRGMPIDGVDLCAEVYSRGASGPRPAAFDSKRFPLPRGGYLVDAPPALMDRVRGSCLDGVRTSLRRRLRRRAGARARS